MERTQKRLEISSISNAYSEEQFDGQEYFDKIEMMKEKVFPKQQQVKTEHQIQSQQLTLEQDQQINKQLSSPIKSKNQQQKFRSATNNDNKSPYKSMKSHNKSDKSPNKSDKSPNKSDKSPNKLNTSHNKLVQSPNKQDQSPQKSPSKSPNRQIKSQKNEIQTIISQKISRKISPNREINSSNSQKRDKSPIKYQSIQKPPSEIRVSKSNFISEVQNRVSQINQCEVHPQYEYSAFCRNCQKFVCMSCETDPKNKSHAYHTIIQLQDLQKRSDEISQDIQSETNLIQKKVKRLLQNLQINDYNQQFLQQTMESQVVQLENQFQKLYEQMKQREEKLKLQLIDYFQSKIQKGNEIRQNIEYLIGEINAIQVEKNTDFDTLNIAKFYNQILSIQNLTITQLQPIDYEFFKFQDQIQHLDNFCSFIPQQLQKMPKDNNYNPNFSSNSPQKIIPQQNSDHQLRQNFQSFNSVQKTPFLDSQIFTQEFRNKDGYSVLPYIKNKSTNLLYSLTKDGESSNTFHQKCDNKGPYICFVEANNHIFGYYMPVNFTSEEKNQMCENCWIFSLNNRQDIKPIKYLIKGDKRQLALHQSKKSPTLGVQTTGHQDLYLNFDDPSHSTARIGDVYQIPNCTDSKNFVYIAGTKSYWNVKEIEIFQIL